MLKMKSVAYGNSNCKSSIRLMENTRCPKKLYLTLTLYSEAVTTVRNFRFPCFSMPV